MPYLGHRVIHFRVIPARAPVPRPPAGFDSRSMNPMRALSVLLVFRPWSGRQASLSLHTQGKNPSPAG